MRDLQKEMIDWMESVLKQNERNRLLKGDSSGANAALETLKEHIMNHKTEFIKPDETPSVDRLPEFWRPLVLKKDAFPDEHDYYASIRVLSLMQGCISEILVPYFKASLIATQRPGEMQALERQIHSGMFERLGSEGGQGTLLERALGYPSPEDTYVDFPAIAAEVRNWREKRPIIRCLLLLGLMNRLNGHVSQQNWLQSPCIFLGGESPIVLIEHRKWNTLANCIDDLLIGDS